MSYLLETLGRGLASDLRSAFPHELRCQPGDTVEALRERLAVSTSSFDLTMRLAAAFVGLGRFRDAEVQLVAARQLAPQSSKPLIGLACLRDAFGDVESAERHLRDAARLDPNDAAIALGTGLCLERAGRVPEARLAYERSTAIAPHVRNGYERLAALAIHERAWPRAIEQYERLAEADPDHLDTLLTLGALLLQAGRATDAAERFQQALFIEPETETPAGAAGGPTDAIEGRIHELQQELRRRPGVAPLHVQLGDLYVRNGDDEMAVESYQAALDTQPQFLEATVKLGTQHMRCGRLSEAAITFCRAIELNERLMLAFVGLGLAQRAEQRVGESDATLDLAASLEPSTTLLFAEAARLALQEAAPDGLDATDVDDRDLWLSAALRRCERTLRDAPNDAGCLYRYGLLLRRAERPADAYDAFAAAVDVNANFSRAWLKLATIQRERDEADAARESFTRALLPDERALDTYYELALLGSSTAELDLACDQFEQAGVAAAGSISFRENLLVALVGAGLIDPALAGWDAVRQMAADPTWSTRRNALLERLRSIE